MWKAQCAIGLNAGRLQIHYLKNWTELTLDFFELLLTHRGKLTLQMINFAATFQNYQQPYVPADYVLLGIVGENLRSKKFYSADPNMEKETGEDHAPDTSTHQKKTLEQHEKM